MSKFILLSLLTLLISCGGQVIDVDENSQDNPEEVSLTRQKQRTIRYNCSNQITSDQIETINSLSKRMQINPKSSKNLYTFNASVNGSTKGHLENKRGIFTIDYSPTVFNLRVYEGINKVYYEFLFCNDLRTRTVIDENGETRTEEYCYHTPIVRESGDVYINVNYSVENMIGIREIRPNPNNCY